MKGMHIFAPSTARALSGSIITTLFWMEDGAELNFDVQGRSQGP